MSSGWKRYYSRIRSKNRVWVPRRTVVCQLMRKKKQDKNCCCELLTKAGSRERLGRDQRNGYSERDPKTG